MVCYRFVMWFFLLSHGVNIIWRVIKMKYGWNIEDMINLSGKILDDKATQNDIYALADMVLKYFEDGD